MIFGRWTLIRPDRENRNSRGGGICSWKLRSYVWEYIEIFADQITLKMDKMLGVEWERRSIWSWTEDRLIGKLKAFYIYSLKLVKLRGVDQGASGASMDAPGVAL